MLNKHCAMLSPNAEAPRRVGAMMLGGVLCIVRCLMPCLMLCPMLSLALCLMLYTAARAQPVAAATAPAAAGSAPLTRAQVDATAQALRSYPTLRGERPTRSLQFKPSDRKPEPSAATPAWLLWLGELVGWLNQAGRWLVWALMAVALAALALWLRRWWLAAAGRGKDQALQLPTQVRGLDIAPESLPADIGSAAWQLWQGGQQLAALSLLYRGALSLLVHRHAVPIRSSSTEGDCLHLAQARLAPGSNSYLLNLVAAWRQAVYAARWPSSDTVKALCEGFSALQAARP